MFEPDWKQFAQLAWNVDLLPVLDALGVTDAEIPRHGRPRQFVSNHCSVHISEDEGVFVVYVDGASYQVGNGDDVISALKLRRGYPDDKALRRWLPLWGWQPPAKNSSITQS